MRIPTVRPPRSLLGPVVAVVLAAPLVSLLVKDQCLVWHGGGSIPWLAAAVIACNLVIGFAYFGIPFELWRAGRSADLRLPWWLRAAVASYAAFILSCGVTHIERAIIRPVTYCTESLVILAVCAVLSVGAWVWTRACRPAIEQLARILAVMPEIREVLGLSPAEAAEALKRVRRGLADARPPGR